MTVLDGTLAAGTTADGGWVPVLVTARLGDPVIGLASQMAHLDGPVAWAAWLAHVREHGHSSLPPLGALPATDFPLPLATWTAKAPPGAPPEALNGAGDAWGWACSRALYGAGGHATVSVRKKPATEAGARYGKDRSWHLGQGPAKARDTPFDATLVTEVRWHALADPAALAALLETVPSLGKLRGHGHGTVLQWTVEPHGDRDAWRDRTWPASWGSPNGIRAPYWHWSRQMSCAL